MSGKKTTPKVQATGRVPTLSEKKGTLPAKVEDKSRVTFRVDETLLDVLVASRDTAGIHGALSMLARLLEEATERLDNLLGVLDWTYLGEALKWWGKMIRPQEIDYKTYVLRQCDEASRADGLAARVWRIDSAAMYKALRGVLCQLDGLECLALLLAVSYLHKYCPVLGEDETWWRVDHRVSSGERVRREGARKSNK